MTEAPPTSDESLAALGRELSAMNRDDSPLAAVDVDELDAGLLTKTEVRRLQRLLVRDMLVSGIPEEEVRERLKIGRGTFAGIVRRAFGDNLGVAKVEQLRNVLLQQLQWNYRTAQNELERAVKTGDRIECLKQCANISGRIAKLIGANMPEKIQVESTKTVQVRLEVKTESSAPSLDVIEATTVHMIESMEADDGSSE